MTSFAWALLAGTLAVATTVDSAVQSAAGASCSRRVEAAATEPALLWAALAAGGTNDECEMEKLNLRFEHFLSRIEADTLPSEARPRAAAIFRRLHAELLTGKYQATCSDVAITLQCGDFNCLTGTILFACAARHYGLDAQAQAAEGHVLSRIHAAGGDFNVETTCPRWFDLSEAEAATAIERAASPVSGPSGRREFRLLSDVQLIAKIHYNRGVACLRAGDFEEGLRLTRESLTLDPLDEVARGNVLAGLNNWALKLCERAEYARAAELLDELRQLDPAYPTLQENQDHLYRAWAKERLSGE